MPDFVIPAQPAIDASLAAHEAEADPHPSYTTEAAFAARVAAAAPNTTAAPAALTSQNRGSTTGGTASGYTGPGGLYSQTGEADAREQTRVDVNLLNADIAALRTTLANLRSEVHDLKDKLRAAGLVAA